jgi:acetolactate synthase-1/2/3 large subunit
VLAKHEYSAACMADGYSRTSNSLGVVMTTSGGGALNAVAALAESQASQRPVLAILGMPPSALDGYGAFQDSSGLNHSLNGDKLFSALASKYFHHFHSSKNFSKYLGLAVEKALTPPFGVSVLLLPKNLQSEQISNKLPATQLQLNKAPLQKIDPAVIQTCVKARNDVLILVGEEVRSMAASKEVEALAETLNALVAVAPEDKGGYKNSSARFVGVSGATGHQSVTDAALKVSTLIIIGTRLQLVSRVGLEQALNCKNIIYINDLNPSCDFSQNKANQHFLIGDLKGFLKQILEGMPKAKKGELIKAEVSYQHPSYFENAPTDPFNFENIYFLFNHYIHENEIIYVDAGNAGAAGLHYLKEASYLGITLGMGGMGYALGASIGSCFERGQITWCFLGDGALLMHGMEIHTAIEYQLPLRFIVFNNNAHAMCYDRDLLYLSGKSQFNCFRKSNYGAGFSAMFPGFYSRDVNTLSELKKELNHLGNLKKPALLSLNVDPREIPPFLPFLKEREVRNR